MDKARDHIAWYNRKGTTGFQWGDAFGAGPVTLVEWTSSVIPDGIGGEPTTATAAKAQRIFDEAVKQLLRFVDEFQARPDRSRVDHHAVSPSSPLPKA